MPEWFLDSLVSIFHMEAVSTVTIFLPNFTTNVLLWFLLGPAQTFLFAVRVEDVHLHKPFAFKTTNFQNLPLWKCIHISYQTGMGNYYFIKSAWGCHWLPVSFLVICYGENWKILEWNENPQVFWPRLDGSFVVMVPLSERCWSFSHGILISENVLFR